MSRCQKHHSALISSFVRQVSVAATGSGGRSGGCSDPPEHAERESLEEPGPLSRVGGGQLGQVDALLHDQSVAQERPGPRILRAAARGSVHRGARGDACFWVAQLCAPRRARRPSSGRGRAAGRARAKSNCRGWRRPPRPAGRPSEPKAWRHHQLPCVRSARFRLHAMPRSVCAARAGPAE